jgi:hypothetical protein
MLRQFFVKNHLCQTTFFAKKTPKLPAWELCGIAAPKSKINSAPVFLR